MGMKSIGLKSIGLGATLAVALLLGGVGAAGAVGLGGICGPILNGACDPGLFCDHKPGTCGLLGGTGTCVRVPAVCPLANAKARPGVVQPVCGCNSVTYSNDCERIKAGERKSHDGHCN